MNLRTKTRFAGLCLLAVVSAACHAQTRALKNWQTNVQQIVAFGDSTIDTGNSLAYFTSIGTPFPIAPFYPGRWTNGPNYLDKIATGLGLSITPSLSGGYNYAVGGALSGQWGTLSQVQNYLARVNYAANPNALYVIQTGENDVEQAYLYWTRTYDYTGSVSQVNSAVANLQSALNLLRNAGARHFLVATVPDLGPSPAYKNSGYYELIRSYSVAWNDKAKPMMANFAGQSSVTQFVMLDAWAMLETQRNSSQSAFPYKDVACFADYGSGWQVCSQPSSYIFWDRQHKTTAYHGKLAAEALRALGH